MIKNKQLLFILLSLVLACASCGKGEKKEPQVNSSPVEIEIKNLVHSDKFVREKAAEKLGELRDAKANTELLATLGDTEGRVRAAAARALGKIGEEETLVKIIELGVSDDDLEVRKSVALAIADMQVGSESAIELLLAYLKDENPEVRMQAAQTFGVLGEKAKSAVPRLIRSLDDTNVGVREASEDALVKIGSAAVEDLAIALKEGRFYIRDSAAQVLTKIGTPEALEALRVGKEERDDE